MNLVWLPEARNDIQRLFQYLIEKDQGAALRMADSIKAGSALLLEHPRAGKRLDDDSGRRELYLPFGVGAYVIRYKLHKQHIVVIRIWHSRESRGT